MTVQTPIKVKFKKLHPDAKIPQYMTKNSSGFDLSSVEDFILGPGLGVVINTGLAVSINQGYELQIRSRSGMAAKHGVAVLNSPRNNRFRLPRRN